MIGKILIANRGEIACRIMATARRMGIATVAVYSEADTAALHVRMADEAVLIGPAPSAESYLVVDRILDAAQQTGAEAVHPGYGFLSENAEFATTLATHGLTFIGPPPGAITRMGDKIESKRLAGEAGVNTIPGYPHAIEDADQAVAVARDIGYPVMLKASAGGGGKGMRIVHDDDGVRQGLASATREATASFGDGRILIEKFIQQPRHIEMQILADAAGNTVYLGERECSIQRRHQKVIEEAPSPFLDEATRRAMGEQAVALARAVGYVSAGTVEFVVDGERNFHFLEMNTRLQVEHPVTERVCGLDLVEWMIRIAAGESLTFSQDDIRPQGWAMEARIYAEDPDRGFMPSAGRLSRFLPPAGDSVRLDSGVDEGGEISTHYDPMIAKLVTGGATRAEAILRMRQALDAFYISGPSHNLAFLAAVMAHPRFAEGRLSTAFIAEEYADGFDSRAVPHEEPGLVVAVAAIVHRIHEEKKARISGRHPGRQRPVGTDWVVVWNRVDHAVSVTSDGAGFQVAAPDRAYRVETAWTPGQPLFQARIDGTDLCLQVERLGVGFCLVHSGLRAEVMVLHPRVAELTALVPPKEAPDQSRFVLSPMPGLLVALSVDAGQEVKAGDAVAVVEAMKMENTLQATRDGMVAAVHARPGDSLAVDQPILEFE
jgi:propionyl-CoA carboxylase alpha chain